MMSEQLSAQRSLALGEVTRTDFVKFAGAAGDFNPMHHDDEFAKAAGFPSVFAMGMFTASLASRLITDWYGLANVRTFEVRFKAPVWPGESLTAQGRVVRQFTVNGEVRSELEFDVVNGSSEQKITGKAEVVLPAS